MPHLPAGGRRRRLRFGGGGARSQRRSQTVTKHRAVTFLIVVHAVPPKVDQFSGMLHQPTNTCNPISKILPTLTPTPHAKSRISGHRQRSP